MQDRDTRFKFSTQKIRDSRDDIPSPETDPGANGWQGGKTVQLTLREVPVRNVRG